MSDWIWCSEQKPLEGQDVLLYTKSGIIAQGVRMVQLGHDKYTLYNLRPYWDNEILAWQPMPKGPHL